MLHLNLSGTWRLQQSVLCTMSNCLAPKRHKEALS